MACADSQHTVGTLAAVSSQPGGGAAAFAGQGAQAGASSAGFAGAAGAGAGTSAPIAGSAGLPDDFDLDAALPDAVPECAATAEPTIAKRVDLYFMIDTNITVPLTGALQTISQAVSLYVSFHEAEGTGLGIDFYGFSGCDSGEYSTPTTPVGVEPLPSNATAIRDAFDGFMIPSFTSPLGPALEGAVTYSRSRLAARPDQAQAVVLFSDGFIDLGCGSNASSVAQVAAEGASAGVRTFVVELTAPSLGIPVAPIGATLIPLDPVANRGGTGTAYTLDLAVDQPADVAATLLKIQHEAEPCDYRLPEGAEWGDAQLAIDDGAGPRPLSRLDDTTQCGPAGGVFLDESTGTPWVRACPTSCRVIHNSAKPPVWLIGCTVVP